MNTKVKVEVVRRYLHPDLIDELVDNDVTIERCPVFEDGQVFIFEDWPTKPADFCDMAWQAINTGLMLCWFDADLDSITIPNKWQACCPDGLRPVVFTIERMDTAQSEASDS